MIARVLGVLAVLLVLAASAAGQQTAKTYRIGVLTVSVGSLASPGGNVTGTTSLSVRHSRRR